jgi:hypothetical protein
MKAIFRNFRQIIARRNHMKKIGLIVLYGLLIISALRASKPLDNPLMIAAVWFVVLVVMAIFAIRRRSSNH